MRYQLGSAKIEEYGFIDRLKIFFVQRRFKTRQGNKVYYYKIYRGRRVLIRTVTYEDRY